MPDSSWLLRVLIAALCIGFLLGPNLPALLWWILWCVTWVWRW